MPQIHLINKEDLKKWRKRFLDEFGDKIEKLDLEKRKPLYRWKEGKRKGENIDKEIYEWDLYDFKLEEVIKLKNRKPNITPQDAWELRRSLERQGEKAKGVALINLSLEDFGMEEGDVEVWYAKSGDWFRWEYNYSEGELELPKNYKDLKKTHIHLGNIEISDPNQIFYKLQAENWGKPFQKANKFIDSKGLKHTSMSVGDIIVYPKENKALIVKSIGFEEIPFSANRKRLKGGLLSKTFVIQEETREMTKEEKELLTEWKEEWEGENYPLWRRESGRRNPANLSSLNEIIKQRATHIADEDDYIRWQNDQFMLSYNDWKSDLTKEQKKTLEKMENEFGLLPFQEVFDAHTEFNIEVFYSYSVLILDRTKMYHILIDGITGSLQNARKDEEFKKFRRMALEYIDEDEFESLFNNVGGGEYVGYIGLITRGDEIVEAIKKGKKVKGKGKDIIIGLHNWGKGDGMFEKAGYRSPSLEIEIENIRLDFGWGSVGDVFGNVDWKYR
jgi:hypothetical protein